MEINQSKCCDVMSLLVALSDTLNAKIRKLSAIAICSNKKGLKFNVLSQCFDLMIKKVGDGQMMAGMKFEGHESNNYCALNESGAHFVKKLHFL